MSLCPHRNVQWWLCPTCRADREHRAAQPAPEPKTIALTLPSDLLARIDAHCERYGSSRSEAIVAWLQAERVRRREASRAG